MTDGLSAFEAGTFLPAGDAPDAEDRPFPPRGGCQVTPLIEAADMYPALERAVLGAARTVHMAFRIFDPATRTHTAEAQALGLVDWAAIVRHVVDRGVVVRLLLADFEPIMAHELHAGSWTTFRQLRAIVDGLPADKRDALEVIVIQHEGELGWGLRQLARLPASILVRRVLAGFGAEAAEKLHVRPGLWPFHRMVEGQARPLLGRLPRLWPSTYHQKFVVVDGRQAIIGGLDVNERRWDDRRHRQRADRTWHDLSVRLEGPAVADAAEHFRRLWNRELPRFRAIVSEWADNRAKELALDPLDPVDPPQPVEPVPGGSARVQVLRTLSRRNPAPWAIGPRAHIRELEVAHRRLILSAERLLYIEAQFFRFRDAARWIVERARARPELEVILLLPNAPEEVAFEGDRRSPHRHGEWLQMRALHVMRRRLGRRLGIFSLAKPARATATEVERFEEGRGVAYGAGAIHVHAKAVIADDLAAIVSSANINGRSFRWDTEFGMVWHDPAGIGAFRRRLWAQLLDRPVDGLELGDALALWRDVATENAARPPEQRRGFIVPHQIVRARRFARASWFVPDDLV